MKWFVANILMLAILVTSYSALAADSAQNWGWCKKFVFDGYIICENTGSGDQLFTFLENCPAGGNPCKQFRLDGVQGYDIDMISVYIRVPNADTESGTLVNNWYYWDWNYYGTSGAYVTTCDYERSTPINVVGGWSYFVGLENNLVDNSGTHIIGRSEGWCANNSGMNRAMSVNYRINGNYYWRVYEGEAFHCEDVFQP